MEGTQQGTPAKPLLQALAGERLERPPWWLMRQAGRYLPEYRKLRAKARDFVEFCLTPELAAEATLQPVRRFGMDAAILFADILLVPLALGQKLGFGDDGPLLEPIGDRKSAPGRGRAIFSPGRNSAKILSRNVAWLRRTLCEASSMRFTSPGPRRTFGAGQGRSPG